MAGKYLLESVLGQGGMGAVYRARHLLTGRKVALKWMFPDLEGGVASVQRFLREARAMGLIEHPSVIGVYDVGLDGEAAFLVMELLRGTSLREHMQEGRGLPPEQAIALLMPALEGVAAAHLAGVVHRDLKPENLFVLAGEDGQPAGTKVLDFGISKLGEDPTGPAAGLGAGSLTRTGAVVGTPSYMAPEQIRGSKDLDGRTDLWALGAILYELLSGELPFEAMSFGGLMVMIATEAPVRLEARVPTLPQGLADAVHRALDKSLDTRWQDIESLARALEPFAPGVRYRAPRPISVQPPPPDGSSSSARFPLPGLTPSPAARSSGDSRLATAPAPRHVDPPASTGDAVRAVNSSSAAESDHATAGNASTRPYPLPRTEAELAPAEAPRADAPKARDLRPMWGAALVVLALAGALGVFATSRGRATIAPEARVTALPAAPARPVLAAAVPGAGTVAAAAPPRVDAPANAPPRVDAPANAPPTVGQAPALAAPGPIHARGHRTPRPSGVTPNGTAAPATPEPSTGRGRTGVLSREEF